MSAYDELLRARARRGGRRHVEERVDAEPETVTGPLVIQGARTQGTPWMRRTPDAAIRAARSDRSVWTRIL